MPPSKSISDGSGAGSGRGVPVAFGAVDIPASAGHEHGLGMHVLVQQRQLKASSAESERLSWQRFEGVIQYPLEVGEHHVPGELREVPAAAVGNNCGIQHGVGARQARRKGLSSLAIAQTPELLKPADVRPSPIPAGLRCPSRAPRVGLESNERRVRAYIAEPRARHCSGPQLPFSSLKVSPAVLIATPLRRGRQQRQLEDRCAMARLLRERFRVIVQSGAAMTWRSMLSSRCTHGAATP